MKNYVNDYVNDDYVNDYVNDDYANDDYVNDDYVNEYVNWIRLTMCKQMPHAKFKNAKFDFSFAGKNK